MNARSPWAAAVKNLFHGQDLPAQFKQEICSYTVQVTNMNNSLWIAVTCPKGRQVILRPAYVPNDHLQLGKMIKNECGKTITFQPVSAITEFNYNSLIRENHYCVIKRA